MTSKFDPYEYTSGFWLRDDEIQRRARRVDFNFEALCQKAIQSCPGANKISRCDKVEGNFNRAFVFHLDNDAAIVARIPFSVAGPPRLITHSEVATLAYSKYIGSLIIPEAGILTESTVRESTTVLVPKVLDWSDDPDNPAGTEYIS